MKIIIIIAALVITGFTPCQKILLTPATNDSPVNMFNEMWKGYDNWYGAFEVRHINWNSIYNMNHLLVDDTLNNKELYSVLYKLIAPPNDIHAFLQPTNDGLPRYESNGFIRMHKFRKYITLGVIKVDYLPSLITIDEEINFGIIEGNIGYIHFGAFNMPVKFYEQQIYAIMTDLKNAKGIIVDIRNHSGRDDMVSRYVAGWFAQERKLFMTVRKRNGPARNDFGETEIWFVDKQGTYQYTNPVKILTTRWTAGAGETFTWAMNTQSQITQMGDTTAGGFTGVISRELPNGWLYFVGTGDYRNAYGKSEEGKGVAPAKYIIDTKKDIDNKKDKVLEVANESQKKYY